MQTIHECGAELALRGTPPTSDLPSNPTNICARPSSDIASSRRLTAHR
jgi:hypothetical protein